MGGSDAFLLPVINELFSSNTELGGYKGLGLTGIMNNGMGVECAEALAEYWHKKMRGELGIDGDDKSTPKELFAQGYRGSRYSFGYPACPEMSHQDILFNLLEPERIGCTLTENWEIVPEQSTSAIIVHHPQAKYFNAK